jgi:hypothetical protein
MPKKKLEVNYYRLKQNLINMLSLAINKKISDENISDWALNIMIDKKNSIIFEENNLLAEATALLLSIGCKESEITEKNLKYYIKSLENLRMGVGYEIYYINNNVLFFEEMLKFLSCIKPILIIWGKLKNDVYKGIKIYEKKNHLVRKILYKEKMFIINNNSLEKILSLLAKERILSNIEWGIIKEDFSILSFLCKEIVFLDINNDIFSSDVIENKLEHLLKMKIINHYKKWQ